jgi:hypothetical protein
MSKRTSGHHRGRCLLVLAALGGAAYALMRKARVWGASPDEQTAELPGDDIIPLPTHAATRSITIEAPRRDVWPWIAQLGSDRGGWYSYDQLENLFGLDIHSAEDINPDWQKPAAGQAVHVAGDVHLKVAIADRDRALVLVGEPGSGGADGGQDAFADKFGGTFTWAFVLDPLGPDRTRLVVRERYESDRAWLRFGAPVLDTVSCVMSRKTLATIKARAEGR